MHLPEHIVRAIASYLEGKASTEEKQIVQEWYYSFNDEEITIPADIAGLREKIKSRMKARLDKMIAETKEPANLETPVVSMPVKRWYKRVAIAAAVIFALGIGSYFILSHPTPQQSISRVQTKDILPPDKTKAFITLANGNVIYLDSASDGTLNVQGEVALIKNGTNEIVYTGNEPLAQNEQLLYHTLYNPTASQPVSLTLTDGTKVWLNSESSLRYPLAFTGKERKVEISGEAYFEVAKDPSKKFIVDVAGKGEVEVLGTHFNINSYSDEEAVKVTLLEGSVKVSEPTTHESRSIKPGQQAIIANSQLAISNSVNMEQVMAWKNGLFHFEGTDLQTVMRQIQRWYNMQVVYETKISQTFYGNIPRQTEASKVFRMLELTDGVHFEIKGNTVIVKP